MKQLITAGAYIALAGLTCLGIPQSQSVATLPPIAHEDCKPDAPISIEILSRRVVAGVAEIEYFVRPEIENIEYASRAYGDARSEVLLNSHSPQLDGQSSFARVRLPADYTETGARVELEASITFNGIDSDSRPSVETQRAVRMIQFGAPFTALEVTPVFAGGEETLDMPANRTEQR